MYMQGIESFLGVIISLLSPVIVLCVVVTILTAFMIYKENKSEDNRSDSTDNI